MNLLGLDLSLTCTGWAFWDGTAARWGEYHPPGRGAHRLYMGRRWIGGLLKELRPEFAVLEGYALGAKGHQHSTAEFGGVVRAELYRHRVAFIEVPPATLKLYATGRGDAPKPKVVRAAEFELGYRGRSNDEADALWLLQIAKDRFEGGTVPPGRAELLERFKWPEVLAA